MSSFDPMPETLGSRRNKALGHAQQMLNIIQQLGSYSEDPLPKYDYGQAANQLNTDVNKDFAATLLLASGGINPLATPTKKAALKRRLTRKP